jgi:WD40 repeat protein
VLDAKDGSVAFVSTQWPLRVEMDPVVRVFDLAFDADGTRLFAACEDLAIRWWSIADWAEHRVGTRTFGRLVVGRDGDWLAAGGRWSGLVSWLDFADLRECPAEPTSMHSNSITTLRASPDGRLLLSASKDGTARLWDSANRSLLLQLVGHSDMVLDARFDARGDRVITASADGTARIWPVRPLELAQRVMPRPELAAADTDRLLESLR